jgi:hypothetical protein
MNDIKHLDTLIKPCTRHADRQESMCPLIKAGLTDPSAMFYSDCTVVELRERLIKLKLVTKSMKGRYSSRNPVYRINPAADRYITETLMMLVDAKPYGDPWGVN